MEVAGQAQPSMARPVIDKRNWQDQEADANDRRRVVQQMCALESRHIPRATSRPEHCNGNANVLANCHVRFGTGARVPVRLTGFR